MDACAWIFTPQKNNQARKLVFPPRLFLGFEAASENICLHKILELVSALLT